MERLPAKCHDGLRRPQDRGSLIAPSALPAERRFRWLTIVKESKNSGNNRRHPLPVCASSGFQVHTECLFCSTLSIYKGSGRCQSMLTINLVVIVVVHLHMWNKSPSPIVLQ